MPEEQESDYVERDSLYAEPHVSLQGAMNRYVALRDNADASAPQLKQAGIELLALGDDFQASATELLARAFDIEPDAETRFWLDVASITGNTDCDV